MLFLANNKTLDVIWILLLSIRLLPSLTKAEEVEKDFRHKPSCSSIKFIETKMVNNTHLNVTFHPNETAATIVTIYMTSGTNKDFKINKNEKDFSINSFAEGYLGTKNLTLKMDLFYDIEANFKDENHTTVNYCKWKLLAQNATKFYKGREIELGSKQCSSNCGEGTPITKICPSSNGKLEHQCLFFDELTAKCDGECMEHKYFSWMITAIIVGVIIIALILSTSILLICFNQKNRKTQTDIGMNVPNPNPPDTSPFLLEDLKTQHKIEIVNVKDKLTQKYEKQLEDLKTQHKIEIVNVKDELTQKFNKQLEEFVVPKLVAIGLSDVGKSKLCNVLAGKSHDDNLFPNDKPPNITKKLVKWNGKGQPLWLIDTPGYGIPQSDAQEKIMNEALESVEMELKMHAEIHLFAFVWHANNTVFSTESKEMIEKFKKMFGNTYRFLDKCVFIISNWSYDADSQRIRKERGLCETTVKHQIRQELKSQYGVKPKIPVIFLDAQYGGEKGEKGKFEEALKELEEKLNEITKNFDKK